MAAVDTYWDGVAAIMGLNPTQTAALKLLAPPWSDLEESSPYLIARVQALIAEYSAFGDGLGATVVTGPAATTANKLAQWDTVARVLKDGRPIGVAASTDIPDRAAADGRYGRLNGSPSFASLSVDAATASEIWRLLNFKSLGQNRFLLGVDNSPDAGASTGSNFHLFRSLDDGSNVDVFTVNRATGQFNLSGVVSLLTGQLKFPATALPSSDPNTLDDYEEGTFNLGFSAATTAPTGVTYSSQTLNYLKIGRLVIIWGRWTLNSKGAGGVGQAVLTGLPFPASIFAVASLKRATGFNAGTGRMLSGLVQGTTISLIGDGSTDYVDLPWSSTSNGFDAMITAAYLAAS